MGMTGLRPSQRRPTLSPAYYRALYQTRLLTRAEECELARAAQAAGPDHPLRERRRALDARNKLVVANLRLVVAIACRYVGRSILDLDDLVEEGNLGLLRATEDFDPDMGFRFSTYASYWIKQACRRALEMQPMGYARLPNYLRGPLKEYDLLRERLGHDPSAEEVQAHLGLTPRRARRLVFALASRESNRVYMGRRGGLKDEGEASGLDLVADPHTEAAPASDLAGLDLGPALRRLDRRERRVIEMRFGLTGRAPMTLEAVARQYHLTRERVRQIERDALKKMRKQVITQVA